jgi:hypothetical protein
MKFYWYEPLLNIIFTRTGASYFIVHSLTDFLDIIHRPVFRLVLTIESNWLCCLPEDGDKSPVSETLV